MVGEFTVPASYDGWCGSKACRRFFYKLFEINSSSEDGAIEKDNALTNDGSVGVVFVASAISPNEVCHILYA